MSPADPSPKGLRSYSVILAAEIGEPAAQMFHRIWYFCACTQSGKVIDGRRWIVNSLTQWQKDHFPHWRALGTVKDALRILKDKGLILPGNHNQKKQDRTLWYTVNFDHPLLKEAGYVEHKPSAKKEPMQKSKIDQCKGQKLAFAKVKNQPMHWSKKSPSYKHRDHREDISKRQSSSSPGREEDEIIDKQISEMKKQAKSNEQGWGNGKEISADSGPEESVSPAEIEGEIVIPPQDPSDDLFMKIYGRVLPTIDLLAAPPKSVDLHPYIRAFRDHNEMVRFFSKEEIRAMSTPGPEALEAKCAEFVRRVLQDQFVGQVQGGFRVMAMRAVRCGFLNRYGFRDFCEKGLPKEYLDANPHENVIWEQW
jgi:hypothetical protein